MGVTKMDPQHADRCRRAMLDNKDHPARQHVTVYCAHCPPSHRYKSTATLEVATARLAAHRARRHPELSPLNEDVTRSKRLLRGSRRGMKLAAGHRRRGEATPEELAERERLRRMAWTDLPALPDNEEGGTVAVHLGP